MIEKEGELLSREHRIKKRHAQSNVSIPVCPIVETSIPQRLKDLSEIDEENEGFVQIDL